MTGEGRPDSGNERTERRYNRRTEYHCRLIRDFVRTAREWLPATHTLAEGSTVADLIVKALADAGMQSVGADKGYVKSETKGGVTLAERDKGPNSGWMYTVNGDLPNVGDSGL